MQTDAGFIAAQTKDPAKNASDSYIWEWQGDRGSTGSFVQHVQHVPPHSRGVRRRDGKDQHGILVRVWLCGGCFPSTHVMWLPISTRDELNKETGLMGTGYSEVTIIRTSMSRLSPQ